MATQKQKQPKIPEKMLEAVMAQILSNNELSKYRLVKTADLLSIAEKVQRAPLYLAMVDPTDRNPNVVAVRAVTTRAYKELEKLLGDIDSLRTFLVEQLDRK